jgi:hypothetical protein
MDLKTSHNTGAEIECCYFPLLAVCSLFETSVQAAFLASRCSTAQKPPAATECTFLNHVLHFRYLGDIFHSQIHHWVQRWRHLLLVRSVGAGLFLLLTLVLLFCSYSGEFDCNLMLQDGKKCALACVAVHVEHQSPVTSFCLHPRYKCVAAILLLCTQRVFLQWL